MSRTSMSTGDPPAGPGGGGDAPLEVEATPPPRRPGDPGAPAEIVRSIITEFQHLFQAHVELAKQELTDAVAARVLGAIAGIVAAVAALFALGFLGSAAAFALDNVVAPWASRLIVAGGYLLVAAIGVLMAVQLMREPPLDPEETRRTLKEDAKWARAQLRR
jgi:uncharacterized membrane protein YqjE